MTNAIEIKQFSSKLKKTGETILAGHGINISIPAGKKSGIIGETGSCKTILLKALLRIPPGDVKQEFDTKTSIVWNDYGSQNILELNGRERLSFKQFLLKNVFYIPQTSFNAVNPLHTLEILLKTRYRTLAGFLDINDLSDYETVIKNMERQYPDVMGRLLAREKRSYEPFTDYSGGQKQLCYLATMAVYPPSVLILDEPTTALDTVSERNYFESLLGASDIKTTIIVTHNIKSIDHYLGDGDVINVLYRGYLVEQGSKQAIFENPKHPYTRLLLNFPSFGASNYEIPVGNGYLYPHPNCIFGDRCPVRTTDCSQSNMALIADIPFEHTAICDASQVQMPYEMLNSSLKTSDRTVLSVKGLNRIISPEFELKNIDFEVRAGETVGIIGKSGQGKSVLIKTILMQCGLEDNDRRETCILVNGTPIHELATPAKKIQYVPQQFNEAFHPLITIEEYLAEPFFHDEINHNKIGKVIESQRPLIEKIVKNFNIGINISGYPHDCSGGEKQRLVIIKALLALQVYNLSLGQLMVQPDITEKLLIMDEPTSSIDTLMEHEVMDVIHQLQQKGLNILIISHDLLMLKQITDRIFVMDNGMIVEAVNSKEITANEAFWGKREPATRELFKALL
jgi:oligopeptide/dipeptide ABC transporter ATP-binding protein